ncbi:MAG: hypothetical protein KGI78_00355 [Patescibacteria group bacterium]|nr:hypothetical protein [Patescibacteria group bacterium]MDE1944844.1 hypothetical protein [Patescibacteria group bacterium]MDE2057290.1 hypothetical protein [Patescibacteria group bacterium]
MHRDPDLAKRIWSGQVGAIEDARKRYADDPKGQFVPWVSTLYSYRDTVPACQTELLALMSQIIEWGDPATLLARSSSKRQAADRADVLSAVLAWAPLSQAQNLRELAFRLTRAGFGWDDRQGHHTPVFLAIRAATLVLERSSRKGVGEALNILDGGTGLVISHIRDRNQRARAYRMLADFYRRLAGLDDPGAFIPAGWYFLRALCVWGIPWDVRRKTLRAALGR